jgi:hypothetical protein
MSDGFGGVATAVRLKVSETARTGALAITPRDTESYKVMKRVVGRAFPPPDVALERYRDAIESGVHDDRVYFDAAQIEAIASVFAEAGDADTAASLRKAADRIEGRGRTRLEELCAEAQEALEGSTSPEAAAIRKLILALRVAARP